VYLKYRERIQHAKCNNCLQIGHLAAFCNNQTVCLDCGKPGHKKGALVCEKQVQANEAEEEDRDVPINNEQHKESGKLTSDYENISDSEEEEVFVEKSDDDMHTEVEVKVPENDIPNEVNQTVIPQDEERNENKIDDVKVQKGQDDNKNAENENRNENCNQEKVSNSADTDNGEPLNVETQNEVPPEVSRKEEMEVSKTSQMTKDKRDQNNTSCNLSKINYQQESKDENKSSTQAKSSNSNEKIKPKKGKKTPSTPKQSGIPTTDHPLIVSFLKNANSDKDIRTTARSTSRSKKRF